MSRLESIREKMSANGIDALIVHDERNSYYLSGVDFSDGALYISRSEAIIITDFRYYEVALKEKNDGFVVETPQKRFEFIVDRIKEHGEAVIGLEFGVISHARYAYYSTALSDASFVDVTDLIADLRTVKDDMEISYMRFAQEITDRAFSHLISMIKPDMTEIEVAAELEYVIRREGGALSFDTIAVSGDASSLPHGVPRNVKLKKGFLTLDFGAKYKGYCSDMTRTIVIGTADEEMKKLYNTVLLAQAKALDYLCMGADSGVADKLARDIIDSHAEYKGTFGHSLGHGVGLEVHESGSLSPRSLGKILKQGEVVTVEPGIYLFGKYGCRIEDMVKIEEKTVYNFTKSTKEMIEIY